MGFAEVIRCKICNNAIPDRRSSIEIDKCRHCYQKEKYGVSNLKNCFKGSVITID